MTASIVSSLDGADRVPFEQIGGVGDVSWSLAYPTGCLTANWSLAVPADENHRAFNPGRRIEILAGLQPVWTGVLAEPRRGSPWTFEAQGLASLAENYMALDGSGNQTSNPNTAVDAAITRGLPWVRVQTLPTPTLNSWAAGTLADLLNQVAAASGMRWGVNAYRQVTMTADPASVTLLIHAADNPGGRTVEEYATALYGRYMDNGTSQPLPKIAASTLNPSGGPSGGGISGRREKLVDLTPAGPISSTDAVAILNGRFPLVQARADFTGDLAVQYGDVTNLGGVPVELTSLTAGIRVRVVGATVDPVLGEVYPTNTLEFTVGQVDVTGAGQYATVTPLGAVKRDLSSLLEVAARTDAGVEGAA